MGTKVTGLTALAALRLRRHTLKKQAALIEVSRLRCQTSHTCGQPPPASETPTREGAPDGRVYPQQHWPQVFSCHAYITDSGYAMKSPDSIWRKLGAYPAAEMWFSAY